MILTVYHMARFQKNKKILKVFYSRIGLIILAFFVVYMFSTVIGLYKKDREVVKNKKEVRTALGILEDKKSHLEEEIGALKTDRGKEEAIREKFRVVKEGENLIVIPEEEFIAPVHLEASAANASESTGFWGFMKEWFKR